MKIVLITQDEPFYITDTVENLLNKLTDDDIVVACVTLSPSPFGKKETFFSKAVKTFKIFGTNFFIYYSIKFIAAKLFQKTLSGVLNQNGVERIVLKQSINHRDSLIKIKSYNPNILISIAGNEIFKSPLLKLAKNGCLNLHTGLLPQYRGLMPTFWALKNSEPEIGISVFLVDEGIDSGPIVVQKKIALERRVQSEVIRQTKSVGVDCIVLALEKIRSGETEYLENHDCDSSYFSFPTQADVKDFIASGAKFF